MIQDPAGLVTRPAAQSVTKPPSFDRALRSFAAYRHAQRHEAEPLGSWIAEAQNRLEQLAWICGRVHVLQGAHDRLYERSRDARPGQESPGERRRMTRARNVSREIEILSEAFYYFGHRFTTLMQDKLPFRRFVASGITMVRNELIEHSVAPSPNFSFGFTGGPQIKPFGDRLPGKSSKGRREIPAERNRRLRDPGLFNNAQELVDAVERTLAKTRLGKQNG